MYLEQFSHLLFPFLSVPSFGNTVSFIDVKSCPSLPHLSAFSVIFRLDWIPPLPLIKEDRFTTYCKIQFPMISHFCLFDKFIIEESLLQMISSSFSSCPSAFKIITVCFPFPNFSWQWNFTSPAFRSRKDLLLFTAIYKTILFLLQEPFVPIRYFLLRNACLTDVPALVVYYFHHKLNTTDSPHEPSYINLLSDIQVFFQFCKHLPPRYLHSFPYYQYTSVFCLNHT